jgi:hypothetical protein
MERNQTNRPTTNIKIFKVAIKGHKCLQRKENKRIPLGMGPLDVIHMNFSDNI